MIAALLCMFGIGGFAGWSARAVLDDIRQDHEHRAEMERFWAEYRKDGAS